MLADPAFNIFYDAGSLIVVCCKARGRFVDADCWLAAENVMLAATAKVSAPAASALPLAF
jgi:hypothetical protein